MRPVILQRLSVIFNNRTTGNTHRLLSFNFSLYSTILHRQKRANKISSLSRIRRLHRIYLNRLGTLNINGHGHLTRNKSGATTLLKTQLHNTSMNPTMNRTNLISTIIRRRFNPRTIHGITLSNVNSTTTHVRLISDNSNHKIHTNHHTGTSLTHVNGNRHTIRRRNIRTLTSAGGNVLPTGTFNGLLLTHSTITRQNSRHIKSRSTLRDLRDLIRANNLSHRSSRVNKHYLTNTSKHRVTKLTISHGNITYIALRANIIRGMFSNVITRHLNGRTTVRRTSTTLTSGNGLISLRIGRLPVWGTPTWKTPSKLCTTEIVNKYTKQLLWGEGCYTIHLYHKTSRGSVHIIAPNSFRQTFY